MFQPNFVKFTNTDIVSREPMGGDFKGNQNNGLIFVQFADGSGGIEKLMKDWHGNKTGRLYPAEILAVQEYLSARVGEVMNAPVRDCRFSATDAKTVIMPFINGESGEELGKSQEDCYPENAQGGNLRLFDYLTANADRRPKNLMYPGDGRIVGIDHALCNFRPRKATPEVVSALWNAGLTLDALLVLQGKLGALRGEFQQFGMGDKFAQMMENLNNLITAFRALNAYAVVEKDAFTPPQGVQQAAKRALEWIADGKAGSGFTSVGRKRASDLGNGHSVSEDTLRRMKAYFDRHQPDKKAEGFHQGEHGYPSPGRVAWDAWGGDAGYSWAKKMVAHFNSQEVKKGDIAGHEFHGNQWETVGNITPQVASFITSNAKKFYEAGGSLANIKSGATALPTGKSLSEAKADLRAKEKDPSNSERQREGYAMMRGNLSALSQKGHGAFLALDKEGNLVGVLGYIQNKTGTDLHVTELGSTNQVPGTATALEVALARSAGNSNIASSATPDAEAYHLLIGRTLIPTQHPIDKTPDKAISLWDSGEVAAVRNLPITEKWYKASKSVQKGDVQGHDFHGNQWTQSESGSQGPKLGAFSRNLKEFYDAGGKVERIQNPDEMHKIQEEALAMQSGKEGKTSNTVHTPEERQAQGVRFLSEAALNAEVESRNMFGNPVYKDSYLLVARDANGKMVAAVNACIQPWNRDKNGEMTDQESDHLAVGYLGSTGTAPGAATAVMEQAAQIASEKGLPMAYTTTADSSPYHQMLGASDFGRGISGFTAEQVSNIASLPNPQPTISKAVGSLWAKFAIRSLQKAKTHKDDHLSDKAIELLAQEQEAHEAGDDDRAGQLHYQVLNEVYK